MKTFTIIEKKWARGGKNGDPQLRNEQGNKCCLGFLATKCGFQRLSHAAMPCDLSDAASMNGRPHPVSTVLSRLKGLVRGKHKAMSTELASKIQTINDKANIDDDERKQRLATLFAQIGWKPVYK